MFKTVNHVMNAPIAELSSRNSSRRRDAFGTPNTNLLSSVHERRCKADRTEEFLLLSSEGHRILGSRDSRKSEIRSRISGKNTAESKKERAKLGPGDDQVIRMRVFNSYKQIKFNGIGGKTNVF